MSIPVILIIIAVICWLLAVCNVGAPLNLTALGLVFFGLSFLVGGK